MTSKPDGDIAGTIIGTIVGVIALIYVSHLYYEKFIRPHGYSVTYTKRQQYAFNSKVVNSEQVRNPLIDDSIVKSNSNIEDGIRKSQRAPVRNPLLNHLDNHNNSSHNNKSSLNKNDSHNNSNSALDEDSNEITEDVVLEGIVKSGYLFKKATNLRKEWLRRWFFIKDSKLYYIHKPSDLAGRSDIKATLVSNLLLSTVKEISPREFHVISPGQRKAITGGGVYELQTDSEADTKSWVQVIRQQILGSLMSSNIAPHHNNNNNNNYNKQSSTLGNQNKSTSLNNINNNINSTNNTKDITENKYYLTLQDMDLQRIRTANPRCADCFALNPDWVSINLCQVICIDCSGIHRSLGSHISKVRSLVLDKWTPYSLELLIDFGNEKASSFWEAKPIGFDRIMNSSNSDNNSEMQPPITRQLREYFITQKYIHKTFRDILLGIDEANVLLLEACRSGDLLNVYIALANQANVNITTPAVSSDYIGIGDNNNDNEGMIQTPLHLCCRNNYLLCAELLCIWNASASFDEIDAEAKTPIDIARERNFTELVAMLDAYKNRS